MRIFFIFIAVLTALSGCGERENFVGTKKDIIPALVFSIVNAEAPLELQPGRPLNVRLTIEALGDRGGELRKVRGLSFDAIATVQPAKDGPYPTIAEIKLTSLVSSDKATPIDGYVIDKGSVTGVFIKCVDDDCKILKTENTNWVAMHNSAVSLEGHRFVKMGKLDK